MSAPSLWQLAKNSVVLWVGLVFVPVGAVLVCVAINLALDELAFAKRGQTADATIVDKSLQKADFDHNPSTRYLIHYRFATPAGVQLDETKVVSVEEWERLAPGSILQIRVLPGARLETRVTQKSDWSAAVALTVLGLIFVAVGAPLMWLAVREIHRQRKLWRTGTTVPAVVTSVAPSSTWINRVQQWEIRYAYTDASGSKHTGRSNSMPRNEATHWRSGDRGRARVDPNAADSSIWLGNATPKD
jgi:hypothetical protein